MRAAFPTLVLLSCLVLLVVPLHGHSAPTNSTAPTAPTAPNQTAPKKVQLPLPGVARNLTVLSVTKDSAVVSWDEPLRVAGAPNVTEYRLQMATFKTTNDQQQPQQEQQFSNSDFIGKCRVSGTTQCVVKSLVPGASYRFRVRAGRKEDGVFGQFSRHLDFVMPMVPPPPPSPRSELATTDSITVVWDALPEISKNVLAPITGFDLEIGKGPASPLSPVKQQEQSGNSTKLNNVYRLDGLVPGSLYRFRVRARNVIGNSQWSEIGAAFTTTNVPAVPQNISFQNITHTSCVIRWGEPESNGGRVNRYDVIMVVENGEKLHNARVIHSGGGGIREATVAQLHPGWKYGFRVRAHNGQGVGQFSQTQFVRLLDPVPNRPPPPTASDVGNDWMRVNFVPAPVSSGALIANYELSMAQEIEKRTTAFSSVFQGSRQHYDVHHLVVGGCYRFRVRTISDTNTVSDWSHDARLCTVSTVPAAPLAPHVVNNTAWSLTVRWSPTPAEHGSPVLRYNLFAMGPAQVLQAAGNDPKHAPQPISVASRYTKVYSGMSLSFDMPTLLPDTVYTFYVTAESAVGESHPSNATSARTLAVVPAEPPRPAVVRRTSRTVVMAFSPTHKRRNMKPGEEEDIEQGGDQQWAEFETLPVGNMELQVAEAPTSDQGDADEHSLEGVALWRTVYDGPERQFELRGPWVVPHTTFLFRTRAFNARGAGKWSATTAVTTANAAPSAIDSFTLVEKDPQHIVVAWDAPKWDNGESVRSYEVQLAAPKARFVRNFGSGESNTPSLAGADWKVVQTGVRANISLLEGLHFSLAEGGGFLAVRVRASNSAGASPWSAPFGFWTRPGSDGLPFPPDQVKRPMLSQVSSSGATVSWHRPQNNGAPIVRFVVEVAPLEDAVCQTWGDSPAVDAKDEDKEGASSSACSRTVLPMDPPAGTAGAFEFGCQTLSDPETKTPASLQCELDNLGPSATHAGLKYMVRVRATNFVGASMWSPPALLVLFPEGHGVPPVPQQPTIAFADTSSVLLRWHRKFVPHTGTAPNVDAFDVGVALVPHASVHALVKLDSEARSLKRKLALLSHPTPTALRSPQNAALGNATATGNSTAAALRGPPTPRDNLDFSPVENTATASELNAQLAQLDAQIQVLTRDLHYIHVHRHSADRNSNNEDDGSDSDLFFRAENLNAGGAYAFKVRAVDGQGVGAWSSAVFAALSPDVPKAPASAPELVEATSSKLVLAVKPGHAQGSPLTHTVVEMSVVEDLASGRWSRPLPLVFLHGPTVGQQNTTSANHTTATRDPHHGTYLLEVHDLPPSTAFAFRVASSNNMGDGPFGPMVRYFTEHAALPKPKLPTLVSSTASSLSLRFVAPFPTPSTKNNNNNNNPTASARALAGAVTPSSPGHFSVSATDFLFASHQSVDANPKESTSAVRFQVLADVGEQRSFVTVCNETKPGCVVDNLRAHTTYRVMVRTVAPWGASSAWSDVAQVTTASAAPEMPLEPKVEPIADEPHKVRISWSPPSSNGYQITGFQVLAGLVPPAQQPTWTTTVCARMPPLAFLASPTARMQPFFQWRKPSAHEKLVAAKHAPAMEEDDNEEEDTPTTATVILVPNPFSPEAIATSKVLPVPSMMIDSESVREDFIERDDPSLKFISVVADNITTLSFEWDFGDLLARAADTKALFVVRVRAVNKKGAGALSPIARFFAAPSDRAVELPPDQPLTPMMARAHTNSLELEWNAPNDHGVAVNLFVLRMLVGELGSNSTQSFQDVFVGSSNSFEVSGLVPSTTYYFYLVAHNAIGYSPPSNLVRFRTAPVAKAE